MLPPGSPRFSRDEDSKKVVPPKVPLNILILPSGSLNRIPKTPRAQPQGSKAKRLEV